jgi:hypothetical protein
MFECYTSTNSAKEVVYLDGTKRSTWAAPSSGSIQACEVLDEASNLIRKQIGEVTYNLALQIEATLSNMGQSVVFPKSSPDGVGYNLHELVSQGEQLDHFHIYSKNPNSKSGTMEVPKTIDWHTDYGFALAFFPGQVKIEATHEYTPSKGFFIQLPDGSAEEVSFTAEDDIVILLGDGVSHINNAIEDDEVHLRAVPHSFVMPDDKDVLRMWYGRMMLFPADMLHSTLNQSFGDVKEAMNSNPSYHVHPSLSSGNKMGYALGCSSPEVLVPRLLADETMTCDDDQFMCWHTCFNNTEEVSPDACESRDLELACVSSVDGSLWDGETHGKEFEPTCILADDAGSSPTNSPNVQATESPTSSSDVITHRFLVPSVVVFLLIAHAF